MAKSVEQVIADRRESANHAGWLGHAHDAELIRAILDEIEQAAEDYLTWLSEAEAKLWTGHRVQWLRARYAELEPDGNAKTERGTRFYRAICLPRRVNADEARAAGRRAAGGER
jgi:hypothetical protein